MADFASSEIPVFVSMLDLAAQLDGGQARRIKVER
jgi:hypothetical protein